VLHNGLSAAARRHPPPAGLADFRGVVGCARLESFAVELPRLAIGFPPGVDSFLPGARVPEAISGAPLSLFGFFPLFSILVEIDNLTHRLLPLPIRLLPLPIREPIRTTAMMKLLHPLPSQVKRIEWLSLAGLVCFT
jgi:hypothetical protein